MVAVHMITALAQKETAKKALLKQLMDAGATSRQMPGSLDLDGDEAQAALSELLASGTVKEARSGAYYLGEAAVKEGNPGTGLVALLAILIVVSFAASLIALASRAN
jgi:hypothetical protein